MKNPLIQHSALLALILCAHTLSALDNPHFYRATNFFGEPRLEKAWLTSFDLTVGAGSTREARNKNGSSTCLLDLYGLHNMHKLGEGVPGKDPANSADAILTMLALQPERDCFGQLLFQGKFGIIEGNFWFHQNFSHGFFLQVHVPFRKLTVEEICSIDLSPNDDICSNENTPIWQAFLKNFDAILCRYGLDIGNFQETGVGDVTVSLGWTPNFEDLPVFDFVDTTFQVGVLIPSAKDNDINKAFSLPLGYNGHIGIPLSTDLAIGAYDWLNFGIYINALFFLDKTKCMRMKTSLDQNGFIKLAQGEAIVKRGSIWHAGAFIKADHFAAGLSALLGYSFANKNRTMLTPKDLFAFDSTIVNSDEQLQAWKMHTLHFIVDYDFAKEGNRFGPRIGFFYNHQLGGKRVFKTGVGGGMIGFDIAWDY